MTTGETVRKMRKEARLSQAALGRLLGVDSNTVSRWERDTREPPPYLVLALEHMLEDGGRRDVSP